MEVVVADDSDGDDLLGSVLEYVVCGGMKGDLFVELMGRIRGEEEEEEE